MIVKQFGLVSTRVIEEDIELIRYWRNQNFIRNTMQFKEYLTPLMQQQWFEKINNKYNYYFIIHHLGKKIGLINCKDSNEEKIAEGGIFIWDKNYWGTSIPAYASLSMIQGVFEEFKSGHLSMATVDKSNQVAIDFNLKLGYQIVGETNDSNCFKLLLTRSDYEKKTKRLIRAAGLMTGQPKFELQAKVSDKQSDEINNYILQKGITY